MVSSLPWSMVGTPRGTPVLFKDATLTALLLVGPAMHLPLGMRFTMPVQHPSSALACQALRTATCDASTQCSAAIPAA